MMFDNLSVNIYLQISSNLSSKDLLSFIFSCKKIYKNRKIYLERYKNYIQNTYIQYINSKNYIKNYCYRPEYFSNICGVNYDLQTSSYLYDALCTGLELPFATSSKKEYNLDIENDIRIILLIWPNSAKFRGGTLRSGDFVLPLEIACLNHNVSIDIIKLLLINGANPTDKMDLNGFKINIEKDIQSNIDEDGKQCIQELFDSFYQLKI